MHQRYAVVGGALVLAYAVLAPGATRDLLYVVIGASCAVAIVVGLLVNRPAARAPWLLMAAGQACWVAGDWWFDPDAVSTVTASDLMYLAAYPLVAVGLADLIRRRRARAHLGSLVDSAIVTVAGCLLSWVYVADPIVDDTSRSFAARAVAVAYPLGDVLLLALLVGLISVPGTRSTTFRLLTAALLLLVVADTVFAAVPDGYSDALDLLWLSSYVLWGAAALHPTMADLSVAPAHRRSSFTRQRLLALVASGLIAPALVVGQLVRGTHVDALVVVAGSTVLTLLVIGRMALNIDELRTTAQQRNQLQARLLHEASHDPLTGLANSASLHQTAAAALRRGQREGHAVTVLLVDVDGFDDITAAHGHPSGEAVLRTVADRLRDAVPDAEHVGRLYGDLFMVWTDSGRADDGAAPLATRLAVEVARPVVVAGRDVDVSVCIGGAVSMDGGTDVDRLLQQAHVALRRAKAAGRGAFEVFGDGLRRELVEQRSTEAALRTALELGELELHYQPVVAVPTEVVDGYEARIHWRRPGRGWQDSEHFMAVAAASDLVCAIDRWAVATAVRHLATWSALDPDQFGDLTVAVEVAGRTLGSPGFVDDVARVLQQERVEPHRLTIGVREPVLVDVPHAVLHLTALQQQGVFVSINAFGTGHTSIGGLSTLPADMLKIDASLVQAREPGARDLLALLAHAAHGCGLLAVAEGVTDADRLAELRELRFDSAQGLYSSTTDPAESGMTVLASRSGRGHLRVVPDPPDLA